MNTSNIARLKAEARNIDFVSTLYAYIYKQDHCFYCNTPLTEHNRTKDHLIPKMRAYAGMCSNFKTHLGGINIVYACSGCNCTKGDMSLYEFWQHVKTTKPLKYKTILRNINNVLHVPLALKFNYALRQLSYLFI